MSQVKFKAEYRGKPVEVMAGWDRPLGHYFMTIFDSLDADEEIFWSSLNEFPGGCPDVKPLSMKLYALGISEPEEFWERVQLREGNVVSTWVGGKWVRTELELGCCVPGRI
jgi:hypothetical protein